MGRDESSTCRDPRLVAEELPKIKMGRYVGHDCRCLVKE